MSVVRCGECRCVGGGNIPVGLLESALRDVRCFRLDSARLSPLVSPCAARHGGHRQLGRPASRIAKLSGQLFILGPGGLAGPPARQTASSAPVAATPLAEPRDFSTGHFHPLPRPLALPREIIVADVWPLTLT